MKHIERLGWKNLDSQEMCQSYMPLLKGVAQAGLSVPKSVLKATLKEANLSLSPSELDLFVAKVRDAISWSKEKIRNSGSGAYLPSQVKVLAKLWGKGKVMKKKVGGRPPGDEKKKKPSGSVEAPDEKPNVRELFGLAPKTKPVQVDVSSSADDDGDDDEDPAAQPSASSSSLPAVDPGSWIGAQITTHQQFGAPFLSFYPKQHTPNPLAVLLSSNSILKSSITHLVKHSLKGSFIQCSLLRFFIFFAQVHLL